ncbi:hypothetical protein Tco_0764363 [Tanacetum coccineum]
MSTIRDIKSKLTQTALDALCTKYHIPACDHPTLPGPDQNILQSPDGKVGVYTRFFDFANYWIPLSQFLMDVLGHFRIHLSQLSVFGAAKVSHFEILCRVHGFQPSVNCFCWMRIAIRHFGMAMRVEMDLFAFIRHSDPTKVRIGEREPAEREVKLLKLTEGRTVSFNPPVLAVSGDSGDSIDKFFDEGNDDVPKETIAKDVSEVVAEKSKKKQKRKVVGDASGSTFPPKRLREDHHAAASNTGGKSLAAIRNLVPDGSSVPSGVTKPPTIVFVPPTSDDGPTCSVFGLNLRTYPPSLRYVVSSDDSHHSGSCFEVKSFARSPAADAPVTTVAVITTVTADVSAVPPPKLNEPADSSDSFYASQDLDSKTLHRIYVPKWNVMNDSVLDDPYVCRDLTDRLAPLALFSQLRAMDYDQLYTEFNVGAARQVCLGAEVRMRAEHTLEQKDRLEDKCSEQTALLSEIDTEIAHLKSLLSLKEAEAAEAIRLRGQISVIEDADAAKGNELRDLKERNFVLEGERDTLFEKVKTLESATALKETELASLAAQVAQLTSDLSGFQLSRDELCSKVASLESKRDSLVGQKSSLESAFKLFRERMEATQDEQAKVLGNRVAELDAQLLEMAAHLDEEFYPRFLTAIFGRRWILTHGLKLVLLKCLQSLEYCHALGQAIGCAVNKGIQDGLRAGVDHGKAGRDLFVIEAYDPSVEAKYVDPVNALGTVDFSLLSDLKSKKDESIVDLIDSLFVHSRVQRVRGEIIEKRLSLTDVMVPLAEPLSSRSLIGEASTSAASTTVELVTTLSTTFSSSSVIPPLSISDYQVSDVEPHHENPPTVTFEEEELDTTLE